MNKQEITSMYSFLIGRLASGHSQFVAFKVLSTSGLEGKVEKYTSFLGATQRALFVSSVLSLAVLLEKKGEYNPITIRTLLKEIGKPSIIEEVNLRIYEKIKEIRNKAMAHNEFESYQGLSSFLEEIGVTPNEVEQLYNDTIKLIHKVGDNCVELSDAVSNILAIGQTTEQHTKNIIKDLLELP